MVDTAQRTPYTERAPHHILNEASPITELVSTYTKLTYPSFPNKFERALIVLMKGKIIKRTDQKIYKNKLSFKRAMRKLHDWKLVTKKENHKGNDYKLTVFGEHIADILKEFYDHSA